MAVTVTSVFKSEVEGRRMHVVTIGFDDAYPTGGEPVTADNVGLTRIDQAIISPTAGYLLVWDQANSKILAYYADYDAGADGALIEVPDTTDINASLTAVVGIFFGV